MKWIISNHRRPDSDGFYFTEDSEGARSATHFDNGTWRSDTGHPVAKWIDETDPEVVDFIGWFTASEWAYYIEGLYIEMDTNQTATSEELYQEFLKAQP